MYKKIEKAAFIFIGIDFIMELVDGFAGMGKVKAYVLTEAVSFTITALLFALLPFWKTADIKTRTPWPVFIAALWAGVAALYFYNAGWKMH